MDNQCQQTEIALVSMHSKAEEWRTPNDRETRYDFAFSAHLKPPCQRRMHEAYGVSQAFSYHTRNSCRTNQKADIGR